MQTVILLTRTVRRAREPSDPATDVDHPFAGDWDLFHEEACALGTCRSKGVGCPATVAFTCTAKPGGRLIFSAFESGILSDPMSDMEFQDYGDREAYATEGEPVELTFSAGDTGCGIDHAVIGISLVPEAGGAPRRLVHTTYSLKLGQLYLRKGHSSLKGKVDLYLVRRGEPEKLAARLHGSAAEPGAAAVAAP